MPRVDPTSKRLNFDAVDCSDASALKKGSSIPEAGLADMVPELGDSKHHLPPSAEHGIAAGTTAVLPEPAGDAHDATEPAGAEPNADAASDPPCGNETAASLEPSKEIPVKGKPGKPFEPDPLPQKPQCMQKNIPDPISPDQQLRSIKPCDEQEEDHEDDEDKKIKKKEEKKATRGRGKAKAKAKAKGRPKARTNKKTKKDLSSEEQDDEEEEAEDDVEAVEKTSRKKHALKDHEGEPPKKKNKGGKDVSSEKDSAKPRKKPSPVKPVIEDKGGMPSKDEDAAPVRRRKRPAPTSVASVAPASDEASASAKPVKSNKAKDKKSKGKDGKKNQKSKKGPEDPDDPEGPEDPESEDEMTRKKKLQSRKSSAYHKAKRMAKERGEDDETAKKKAQEATWWMFNE